VYWLGLFMAVVVGVGPADTKQNKEFGRLATQAIEDFTPNWMPDEKPLRGCVVGINAVGGGASSPQDRVWEDLSLLTAGYLYYMVTYGGGVAVVTRDGDSLLAPGAAEDAKARARLINDRRCDVCVSIRYLGQETGTSVNVVMGFVGGPVGPGYEFAEYMKSALNAKLVMAKPKTEEHHSLHDALYGDDAERVSRTKACEVHFCYAATNEVVRSRPWKVYRPNAQALYEGIARYAQEKLKVPDKKKPSPKPEVTTKTRPGEAARLARSLWPEGDLPKDRVDWFCGLFAKLGITNRSLTYFETSAAVEDGVVILRGATSEERLIAGLEAGLRAVGIKDIRSEIRQLPDRSQLGDKLFGACQVPMARTFRDTSRRSGMQTQLMFGEPVFLLDRADGHYLLHAGDGYWGWVAERAIRPMTVEEFNEYTSHPWANLIKDVDVPNLRILRGSRLPVAGWETGKVNVLLPDGSQSAISASQTREWKTAEARSVARARAALDLLYVPYVFAGRSPLGLDCSGLITNVAARVGDDVPARDAWQQALAGALVATDWHRDGIRAGDIVYFVRTTGRIYHVGIAISPTHIVHSAPPGVHISSIKPGDPLYARRLDRDFFMAKRP